MDYSMLQCRSVSRRCKSIHQRATACSSK